LSLRLTKHHAMKTYWGSGGIKVKLFLCFNWAQRHESTK
jgi:hypothetical protein